MEIKTAKIEKKAEATIELNFDSLDLEKAFEKFYQMKQKTAKIPGFRPGKAPLKMVKNHISKKEIQADVFNHLIQETIQNNHKTIKPNMFSFPNLTLKEYKENEKLLLKGFYETTPEIELCEYKNIKVQVNEVFIEESNIENELNKIQKKLVRKQLAEENETTAKDHLVSFMWSEKKDKEKKKEKRPVNWYIGENKFFEDFEKNLLGLKVNETKEFSYTYPKDFVYQELANTTYHYDIKVESIYKLIFPEINDNLAIDYDENLKTLQELREKIKIELNHNIKKYIEQKGIDDIYKQIIDRSHFSIPQSLIQTEFNFVFKNILKNYNLSPSLTIDEFLGNQVTPTEKQKFIDNITDRVNFNLKRYYIKEEIAKKEKIQIDHQEIEKYIEEQKKTSQGNNNQEKMLSDKNWRANLEDSLETEKVNDFLFENAEKKYLKKMSYNNFLRQEEQENN